MSKDGGWDGPTLLITCDFLGSLEKKMYFCNLIKRLKGEGYVIGNKKHSCSYR